ncbi:2-oxo acid dehydrogenase subunit E2 [Xylanibacillus composti]|uniref:Dihydrolipoamide acetyltransferase component of pyruvate dehydrogenase complex n=1 Tax=Xylanibacillus composti TaxID=1572762 RepID=A0A8J4H4L3_9BACL|nr:dihydrolipoamide acetyltransferase family protein [Xylanibacillus composti]MDT9726652.1 2-oxo acid dehydrogenase subunit E2 [Xylanibacillus composti]GIQ69417.1 lipoamide acyltransferase component of branched-chain alpha-keto acid dehydrogenase complex [Xylanibacillus composti]
MAQSKSIEITLPQLAESVVDATITKWLKQPGDPVEEYEALCEIVTDKVTAELPSTASGVLDQILVGEGENVAVGTVVCTLRGEGAAQEPAGTGSAAEADSSVAAVSAGDQSMRSRISPAVRTLADEHGIDLNLVAGSGLGGRITRKDVLAYLNNPQAHTAQASAPAAQQPARTAAASQASEEADAARVPVRSTGLHLTGQSTAQPQSDRAAAAERGEELIDVSPIRATIASRMRQSVSEIPHAWTMIEVDVTNLVTLRNKLKDEFMRKEGVNLTYLAFLIKAVVNAIKDYPIMNSVWAVDKIIVKKDINISLAVGTEDAVFMPVIKKADQMNVAGLAKEIDQLTKRARAGTLRPDDVQGGTFTVNNTGAFGSILSQPIINYPQACNFTFESIVKKPVVIDDMIAVRSMVNLCLSLDHRILDGVICGRFLQRVKENLEAFDINTKLY